MSSIPNQYKGFQNLPDNLIGGLSPLQLAANYYMVQGQQVPFFINHDWLRALRVYCDSGILNPRQVGGTGPVIVKDNTVYTIERAPDCGPNDFDRTELVNRGSIDNISISVWKSGSDQVIRGGSAANGSGGPWGTGGITGPSPVPGNSVDQPTPVVSNVASAYAASSTNDSVTMQIIQNPTFFGNNIPFNLQGIA